MLHFRAPNWGFSRHPYGFRVWTQRKPYTARVLGQVWNPPMLAVHVTKPNMLTVAAAVALCSPYRVLNLCILCA